MLAYATARGVPITVGTITPNAIAPYAEALDQSCAEVIRNFLRWTPDAMAAFDYTTTPYPTLSIHRRADAATVTLPAYGAPVSGLDLTPRYDLQAPAVVLKFEQTNDIDNDTFTSLIVQPAPSTATGDELGALVMTLDLSGARATYQKQPVRTAPIPPSDTSAGVIDWWKGKFAWLNDFADSDLDGGVGNAVGGDRESGELSGADAVGCAERVAGGFGRGVDESERGAAAGAGDAAIHGRGDGRVGARCSARRISGWFTRG